VVGLFNVDCQATVQDKCAICPQCKSTTRTECMPDPMSANPCQGTATEICLSECSHKVECRERKVRCHLGPDKLTQPPFTACPVCNSGAIGMRNTCELSATHNGAQPLYHLKSEVINTCTFTNSDFVPLYQSTQCEPYDDSDGCKGALHYVEAKCCNNVDYPDNLDGWFYREVEWTKLVMMFSQVGKQLQMPCDQATLDGINGTVMMRMQEVPCTVDNCSSTYFPASS